MPTWRERIDVLGYETKTYEPRLGAARRLARLSYRHSSVGARNVASSLRATIARLSFLPHLGRRTDQPGVLMLVEPDYGYRVFYRIDEQAVTVIRILHRSQR